MYVVSTHFAHELSLMLFCLLQLFPRLFKISHNMESDPFSIVLVLGPIHVGTPTFIKMSEKLRHRG